MHVLYEDQDVVVHAQTHPAYPNQAFIHCTVHNWNVAKYRAFLDIWAAILDELHGIGCTHVNSIIPKRDMKTRRFQTMFGLSPKAETEEAVWYTMEV